MVSENIKKIRTEKSMTQKELADKLHVTAQAVSRWETGEVEVSVTTLQEMCKIFNVSLDELVGGEKAQEKPVATQKEEPKAEPPKPVLALCEKCNRPIYNTRDIVRQTSYHRSGRSTSSTTHIICRECDEKEKRRKYENAVAYGKLQRKRSFVWGGLLTVAIALITFWITSANNFGTGIVIGSSVGCLLFFPFLSCLFLQNNFIMDMITTVIDWGSVKLPGLIFSLDLDGIVWFLTVKLAFWVIGIFISILMFLFAIALGLSVSIFVYPYALRKNIRNPELTDAY